MCEFFSWIEVRDGRITSRLYLRDSDLFTADGSATDRVKEVLEGSKDKDFIGHHAIEAFWGPKGQGEHKETREVWNPNKLPKEFRPKFKDGETVIRNFGMMLREYADDEALDYLMVNVPETDDWRSLRKFTKETLLARCKNIVRKLVKRAKVKEFTVKPDNGDAISELVKGYDWKNNQINDQNFPAKPKLDTRAILIDFQDDVSSWSVDFVADALGYRLANARETLIFGQNYPSIQRKVSVVGLGEEWQDSYGERCVVILCGGIDYRRACLDYRRDWWPSRCRFLAFRK